MPRAYYYNYVDGILQRVRRSQRPEGWKTYEELKNNSNSPEVPATAPINSDVVKVDVKAEPKVEPKGERFQKEGEINDEQILKDTIKKLVKAEVKIKEQEVEIASLKRTLEQDPAAWRRRQEEKFASESEKMITYMKEAGLKEETFFEMKRQNAGYAQRIKALEDRNKELERLLSEKNRIAFKAQEQQSNS